jgi:hypothetical protein
VADEKRREAELELRKSCLRFANSMIASAEEAASEGRFRYARRYSDSKAAYFVCDILREKGFKRVKVVRVATAASQSYWYDVIIGE